MFDPISMVQTVHKTVTAINSLCKANAAASAELQDLITLVNAIDGIVARLQSSSEGPQWNIISSLSKQILVVQAQVDEYQKSKSGAGQKIWNFVSARSRLARLRGSHERLQSMFALLSQIVNVNRAIPQCASNILTSAEGQRFWISHFGSDSMEISVGFLMSAICHEFGLNDPAVIPIVRSCVCPNGDDTVTIYDFASFSNSNGVRETLARALEAEWITVPDSLFNPLRVKRVEFQDGRVSFGELLNNKLHGRGWFIYPDGRKYHGGYKEGLRHGFGVYTKEKDGVVLEKYEGSWQAGKRQGYGRLTLPSALTPEGSLASNAFILKECEWDDDKIKGRGKFQTANGSCYEGDVIPGGSRNSFWMNGYGIFTWNTGKRYEGQWQKGRPHGYGTLVWPHKQRYDGEFKCGKVSGKGKFVMADGRTHEGDYEGNNAHGHMKSTWPDGVEFEGHYCHGCRDGLGEYRFGDGTRIFGEFHEDQDPPQDPSSVNSTTSTGAPKSAKPEIRFGSCAITLRDGTRYEGRYSRSTTPRCLTLLPSNVIVDTTSGRVEHKDSSSTVGTSDSSGAPSSMKEPDSITGQPLVTSMDGPLAGYQASTSSIGMKAGADDVNEWLAKNNLSEYAQALDDAGYDDLDIIAELTEDEIRSDLGITKPGHVKKMVKAVQSLADMMMD